MVRRKAKPRSRYQNYAGAAKQLYNDVAMIKRSLNTEKKHIDVAVNATLSQTGLMTLPILPIQGDGDGERVGDKLKVTSVHAKFKITASSSSSETLVRVIWFWEKESDTTTGKYDLIHDAGTAYLDPMAFYNKQQRREWILISDKVYHFGPNQTNQTRMAYLNKNCSKHVTFVPSTATPNSMVLKCLAFSNEPLHLPTFQGQIRSYYVDN